MIGKTVSHYQIVGQLGQGGMGVVYEAKDDRLGRSVALKFVPDNLKDDTTLKRLRAEARTASLLSHPNICTVYDIGESDGRPFIVMELLRGESLRERLVARPMRLHEVVELSIQTADALDYAHSRGVMHRDIKPANLFINDRGQMKIVDFGLAKLVRMQDSTFAAFGGDLTATGVTPGTVSYMSPEQISDHELDGRSDLFSFGVVLYECVTGQKPFTGQPLMVLAAILNQAPAPPMTLNAEVPPRLQDVIHKCLEKDRELRYQSAGDLRADLRRVKRDLESGPSTTVTGFERSAASLANLASVSQAASRTPMPSASAPAAAAESHAAASSARRPAMASARMGLGALAAVAVVAAGGWYLLAGRAEPASPAAPPAATTATVPAAPAADTVAAPAANAGAVAAERLQRFDQAVARARAALRTGDFAAATSAIDSARSIDPASPVVNDLSSRLVADLRARGNAPPSAGAVARGAGASVASPPPPVVHAPQAAADSRAPETSAPAPAPAAEPQVAPRPAPVPVAPTPPPSSRVSEPPPAPTPAAAPPPQPAAAALASAPSAEDDDAAIRRAIATYVHAIESKDVALFRSIKPNTSTEEQRRIEEGFRAVTSQRVAVRVLGIERRGADALVRLRRTDTIDAGGRQRTTETEQTMTLTRGGTGWIIRDIGR